ncbi:VOC family protein [Kribbella sandramycini]|uniref:Catechol 2,3-dioxygenase-like lactoylglutathione lyase family enzyme n=1 Tax=Kribbella sandramycini TaxID=60450 RepID=A0A7Y4P1B1_9ACTN|nr:VOC family protein [Kribbella sandramycini]MBB6571085.1 catechol 2,3-dioxygenase-like lactoylglutathione lyase family enzyme [Kribbella sandramycini]NOL43506.1 VOC family protein [Kribbella sandramycini]
MTTFASTRIVTDDVDRLTAFYEHVTGLTASRPTPLFAEFHTAAGTLAISSSQLTDRLYGADVVRPAANRTAFLEFQVADADAEFDRLTGLEFVQEPTTMPWGNRSVLLRDPDGNLVNLFTTP